MFLSGHQLFIEQLARLEHRPHDRQQLAGGRYHRHFLALLLAAHDPLVEGLQRRTLLDRPPDAFHQQPANHRGTFLADVAQPPDRAALIELGRQAEVGPELLGTFKPLYLIRIGENGLGRPGSHAGNAREQCAAGMVGQVAVQVLGHLLQLLLQ